MGLTLKWNARQLEANLQQVSRAAMANGARSLRRIAMRIQKLAQDNAPIDDGELENAIKIEERTDGNRRKAFTVYVDGNEPAGDDKTVGDYAILQERYLTPAGKWQLGDGSQAKRDGGKDVGGRFMDRAVKKGAERAVQDVGNEMRAMFKSKASLGLGGRIRTRADYRADHMDGDDE